MPPHLPKKSIGVGESLDKAEEMIMVHLASGLSTEEAATTLGYDHSSINYHLRIIQHKLGAKTRISAMHAWTMLQPRHLVLQRVRGPEEPSWWA